MMKEEFLSAASIKSISDNDYAVIEEVYAFHPSISATNGKGEIASLYSIGGMRLIYDMLPTARKAAELENQIQSARHRLEELQAQFAALKSGVDFNPPERNAEASA